MNKRALILGIVLLVSSVLAIYFDKMLLYMGLFFIIFSIFKLVDVKGFAKGFQKYDLLAKRSYIYSASYPFLELLLGVSFLLNRFVFQAAVITIIIMSIGAISVFLALKKKQKFTCACLGTRLGIPLTHVTLFENVIMILMGIMLLVN